MDNIIEQAKAQSKIAESMTPIRNRIERNIAASKSRGYDDGLLSLFYMALFSAEQILRDNGSIEDCDLWIRDFGDIAR